MVETTPYAVRAAGLSKVYRTYPRPMLRLREFMSAGRRKYHREVVALNDVSFELAPGERLGIVGENGSGKSTLLKILASVLMPTKGEFAIKGRIAALLELGAGFHHELSGRENIRQFGMLHGLSAAEIDQRLSAIIAFSELNDAIEHPVKTYSSGMGVRLGFACAVHMDPDILIVDEALSVGDAYFQNKCLHKIKSMLDRGTTFIYVTHAADSIRALCSRGLWLEHGRLRQAGSSAEIGRAYERAIFSRLVTAGVGVPQTEASAALSTDNHGHKAFNAARATAFAERVAPLRTGSGEVQVEDLVMVDETGTETDVVAFRTRATVRVVFRTHGELERESAVTAGIVDATGRQLVHFNSLARGIDVSKAPLRVPQVVEFVFDCPLTPGEYGLVAGVATMTAIPHRNGQFIVKDVVDYCVGGARFSVAYPDRPLDEDLWGLVHVDYCAVLFSID